MFTDVSFSVSNSNVKIETNSIKATNVEYIYMSQTLFKGSITINNYGKENAKMIIDKIKSLKMNRLETSNKAVFDYFYNTRNFKYHQICLQCHHKRGTGKAKLNLPSLEEIKWVAETYGTTIQKIAELSENRKIFVYHEKKQAISYIGIHADGSVGFLYTKPEYREKGYSAKIQNELFKIMKEPIFAQILEDNKLSIERHRDNNWHFNRYKIYWLFNKRF